MSLFAGTAFFSDLSSQIEQDVIVDDEETLARIAMVVPSLIDALYRTLPFTSEGLPALRAAEQAIASVIEA